MTVSAAHLAGTLELALVIIGAVLLWRLVLSPAARMSYRGPALPAWNLPLSDFFVFLVFVMLGSLAAAGGAHTLAPRFGLIGDAVTVFSGAGAQLGMLLGVAAFHARRPRETPLAGRREGPNIFISGAVTFLVALPILIATAKAWEIILRLSGLPVDRQDLIGMFKDAESPLMLAIMIVLAIVIAPITEELVFRAGLFRYLRTRIPRIIALTAPALFFAALHVDWNTLRGLSSLAPLAMLAVVFSLAYERTGQIGTAMVAHAFFNLNTVVLILSGMPV